MARFLLEAGLLISGSSCSAGRRSGSGSGCTGCRSGSCSAWCSGSGCSESCSDCCNSYKIPPKTILNINVPGLEKEDIAGIAVTELGGKMFTNAYEKRTDPRGKVYYWMAGELVNESEEAHNSDITAIRNNMISITPITYDMTRRNFREDIQQKLCRDAFCDWFND